MKTLMLILLALFSFNAQAAKRALVYNGPGACDGCYQAANQIAIRAGLDPTYVNENGLTETSTQAEKEALFKDVVVWLQPGGKSSIVMQNINDVLKSALQDYVKAGGGYVGFCAGAFASTEMVGTTSYLGYGFLPGSTKVYKDRYQADVVPITWNGKVRNIYWEGGPYIYNLPNDGDSEVIATYPNGQVAAARSHFGKGKVFVSGVHPEATQDWFDDYGMQSPSGLNFDLAVDMVNWAIQ